MTAPQVSVTSLQEWADDAVHLAHHHVQVGRDAKVKHSALTFGGDLVRLVNSASYAGPGGEVEMLGLYFADAGQHLEHRLFIDHSAPHCRSRVLYKGALQGRSAHTVWVGDVLIRNSAVGTDTYELNRNLLLTEGARADSVPNLEIETGEIVGAGHASATGRFDDEQLFYLLSRGIPETGRPATGRPRVLRRGAAAARRARPSSSGRRRPSNASSPSSASDFHRPTGHLLPVLLLSREVRTRTGVSNTMATLQIRDLHVSVITDESPKEILTGVDLTVTSPARPTRSWAPTDPASRPSRTPWPGTRSTGSPPGTVALDGQDVLAMTVDQRARAGLFLAMQYPVEVPGVSMSNFLRTAATAVRGETPAIRTWVKEVKTAMSDLDIDPAFAERSVNEGFSGGEKKRHEILQLSLLRPQIAVLDETDSGLDVDALRVVCRGCQPLPGDRGGARWRRGRADHPLHPDPALHPPRLRARLRRRQDRRVRWTRAGR